MRIKEAAAAANLTEKAIRLYEERGLITPTVTEKNGRQFRDYNEETVRRLQTVAALRRAFFSLDQIAQMLESPDNIPAVFAAYRADIEANYSALKPLLDRASSLDTEALPTVEAVSEAMTRPDAGDHAETLPSFHFRVWNEEMARDEREAAYLRCQKYMQNWGWQYDIEMFVSRYWKRSALAALVITIICTCPIVIPINETVTGYALYYSHADFAPADAAFDMFTSAEDARACDTSAFPMPEQYEEHTVTIRGKEYHYLFREDKFVGEVDISGYRMYAEVSVWVGGGRGQYDWQLQKQSGDIIVPLEDKTRSHPLMRIHIQKDFVTQVYFISDDWNRQLYSIAILQGSSIRRPMLLYMSPAWEPLGTAKQHPFSGVYEDPNYIIFAADGSIDTPEAASAWYWENKWKADQISWLNYCEKYGIPISEE